MKKILITALFVASLVFGLHTTATAQTSCPTTTSNYVTCCPSGVPAQAKACADFKASFCSTSPTDPFCQTIRGGTPNTNPTNRDVIAPTPSGSSKEVKACATIAFDSLLDILIWLKCIIASAIIPLIFTLAFLYFLWGMVMFIRGADDVKKREESKKFIYWGIIGLTVMIAVWGIVRIVTSTFGLGNTVPQLQTADCLTTNKDNPCK